MSQEYRISAHPAVFGFVLLYLPLLAYFLGTISFSAADDARRYAAQTAKHPPGPLPRVPVVNFIQLPAITLQRDPFQRVARLSTRASGQIDPTDHAATGTAEELVRFIAAYSDAGQSYVLGRGPTGGLARFGLGDDVGTGIIDRIEAARVVLHADGKQRTVEIAPAARRTH